MPCFINLGGIYLVEGKPNNRVLENSPKSMLFSSLDALEN
jgi:hypothetical protein